MWKLLFSALQCSTLFSANSSNAQLAREPDKRLTGIHIYYNDWLKIEPKDRLDAEVDIAKKSIPEIKILLKKMFDADQQYRDSLHHGMQTAEKKKYYWIKIIETDWVNQLILDKIIAKYGWPTIDQFERQGAEIAWYIIWHADREFAAKHLRKVEQAYNEHKILAGQYLLLREKWGRSE